LRRAVFFHPLEAIGGGERVALEMARALIELGYRVDFYTVNSRDARRAMELLLGETIPIRLHELDGHPLARILGVTGRFSRLRYYMNYSRWLQLMEGLRREALVIDTRSNTVTPVDIVYIHYPQKKPLETYQSLWWRLYERLVAWYASRLPRGDPHLVLANSSWTAGKAREILGVEAGVLHPPVDVEYYSRALDGPHDERLILVFTRYAPEKRLDRLLRLASIMRGWRFVFIGGYDKYSRGVLRRLFRIMDEEKLDNVALRFNLPRKDILEEMRHARYIVHPPYPEHFGISIVEAMAAGLVPIVSYIKS
jgi:alpha-1,2-mannosyltransferase